MRTTMDVRPKINWTVVKEIEEAGVIIQISASDSSRPRYTLRLCRRRDDTTVPFMPVFTDGQGTITVRSIASTAAKLIAEAEEFVRDAVQKRENEWLASRIEQDERGAARDGKKRRKTGYRDRDEGRY